MNNNMMKIYNNIYLAFIILITSSIVFICTLFNFQLGKVSNNDSLKEIKIEQGTITDIANILYKNKLIKNKKAFKIYVILTNKTNLKAATYKLSENMGTRKIVNILSKGGYNNDISITFKEGINIRKIAKTIEEKTNNKEEDIYKLLKDEKYLDKLIEKYWFLEDTIKNNKIYYSLEGYLYPDTYSIKSKDTKVEEIIEKMLDNTEEKLKKDKSKIEKNKMSVHEILTLASIIELEGSNKEDRKGIASVFFNRMNSNMTLGSDVTTYYGVKIDMSERALTSDEVKECNDYNTRCPSFTGLPISPICIPSIETIKAVLEPDKTDYYYFVADKNKKIYFSRNQTEHNNTIYKLKKEGLWYEY